MKQGDVEVSIQMETNHANLIHLLQKQEYHPEANRLLQIRLGKYLPLDKWSTFFRVKYKLNYIYVSR